MRKALRIVAAYTWLPAVAVIALAIVQLLPWLPIAVIGIALSIIGAGIASERRR